MRLAEIKILGALRFGFAVNGEMIIRIYFFLAASSRIAEDNHIQFLIVKVLLSFNIAGKN